MHVYIIYICMPKYILYDVNEFIEIIGLSIDSEKKYLVGEKWGTSDFSWGLVTFQGYSSPRPVENLA